MIAKKTPKNTSPKKGSAKKSKGLALKTKQVFEKDLEAVEHVYGRVYHIGDYELERIASRETEFLDKEGKVVPEKIKITPESKPIHLKNQHKNSKIDKNYSFSLLFSTIFNPNSG